jgi:hypothetical protein
MVLAGVGFAARTGAGAGIGFAAAATFTLRAALFTGV